MAEIPAVTVAAAVETAIAVPVVIPVPVGTTIPAVIPIAPAEAAIPIPAARAGLKKADEVRTETEDLPDRISRTLHRWMIRHFPEEMTEDVRLADVSRIPETKGKNKAPELWKQFRGLICLK